MARKVTLSEIAELAQRVPKGYMTNLYLHWTAGSYNQVFDDYHINITGDGSYYVTADDFTTNKAHTWMRNSRAMGLTLCCCAGAGADSQGLPTQNPPTAIQIENMSKLIATLAEAFNLEITIQHVMTHAEAAANKDGKQVTYNYGPVAEGGTGERWDLWKLKDFDGVVKDGGFVLRGKAIWYQQN